jgi:hypothetical protein
VPQARSGGSKSSSGRSTSGSAGSKRSAAGSSGAARSSSSRSTRSSGAARSSTKSSGNAASAKSKAASAAADPRLEAAAQRLRKLNERIIEAGKEAGETTLTSYEKALKAIASSLERGPGSSDIEWLSHLATTQAKFIRDVTTAWTSAARGVLK